MKVIHFADTHLREHGKFETEYHLHGRTIDTLDSLDTLIGAIIEEDVDLVLFAGDAFHSHNPNQNILYLFAEKISEIAQRCPIVMVPGNHDMPGPIYKASSIDVFGLEIPGVIVANEYKIYNVDTKSGIVQIGAFPYPMRQHILSGSILKRPKKDTLTIYKGEVLKLLTRLSTTLKSGLPSILLGHLTISGAVYGSERPMILDMEAEINLVDLVENTNWDYVALGHIHKHQQLFDDPPVIYAGSLDRIDFSEENDPKGFMYIEIENGRVDYKFIDVESRPMLTIRVDVLDMKSPMGEVISNIESYGDKILHAIVRVIIQCDSELYIDKNEINSKLEELGMMELHSITAQVPYEHHSRLDSDKPASSYTEEEMLEIFFEDLSDDDYDEVMDVADIIMGEVIHGG